MGIRAIQILLGKIWSGNYRFSVGLRVNKETVFIVGVLPFAPCRNSRSVFELGSGVGVWVLHFWGRVSAYIRGRVIEKPQGKATPPRQRKGGADVQALARL
jgi:hypothetical protein